MEIRKRHQRLKSIKSVLVCCFDKGEIQNRYWRILEMVLNHSWRGGFDSHSEIWILVIDDEREQKDKGIVSG